jgi:hypothetical protein
VNVSDDELLESIALLYAAIDPPPGDLAEGVLARMAVDDLETEYELLTLVERVDLAAGTRATSGAASEDDDATVALEFAGTSYRVLVRISTVDKHRRLDGWVVPAVPIRVFLGPPGDDRADTRQSAYADEDGRFAFAEAPTGQNRLWLLPQTDDESQSTPPPFVTPPFLI